MTDAQRNNEAGSPAKRRKVGLACEACRTRKARCNGVKPRCGNCTQRQEQCVYRLSTSHLTETNQYIDTLVNRVSELERELQRTRDAMSAASAIQFLGRRRPGASPVTRDPVPANQMGHPESREALILAAADSQSTSLPSTANTLHDVSSPVDGMGGNANGPGSPNTGGKFYGSSSSMSFMKQFYHMISRSGETVSPSRIDFSGDETTENNQSPSSRGFVAKLYFDSPESFSLMPRILTDYLLELYWDRVYPLYPFLHRATFIAAYEQLWTPASTCQLTQKSRLGLGGSDICGYTTPTFHCALNAMMLLGVQFSDFPVTERNTLANTLSQKAKGHFNTNMFDDGSIHVIQTLLLLVQVFQFTTFPTRCWSTMGAACRLAQGLGLHLADSRFLDQFNPLEAQLRKKIWHGCVMLDMVVSMTLGRPAMLHQGSRVPLPVSVDDEYIERNEPQPPNQIAQVAFFVEAIKLYTTLNHILSQIYAENENDRTDSARGYGSFDRLIELDTELARFAEQVPDPIKWTRDGPYASSMLAQQSHVLHVRYLHLRILLYRPTFTQFCRLNASSSPTTSFGREQPALLPPLPISTSFARSSSLTCVRSAIDLIEITDRHAATLETGAWWYNMFYTRTAAMVVLIADLCPLVRESIGSSALVASWQKCRNILLHKLPQDPTVETCLQTLENMREHVLQFNSLSGSEGLGAGIAGAGQGNASSGQEGSQSAPVDVSRHFGNTDAAAILEGFNPHAVHDQVEEYLGNIFNDSAFNFAMDDYGMSLL